MGSGSGKLIFELSVEVMTGYDRVLPDTDIKGNEREYNNILYLLYSHYRRYVVT